MIRKLDLFLSNHSRFPAKQVFMKASCSKKEERQKPRWNRVEETELSEREIQNLLCYDYQQGTHSLSIFLQVLEHR